MSCSRAEQCQATRAAVMEAGCNRGSSSLGQHLPWSCEEQPPQADQGEGSHPLFPGNTLTLLLVELPSAILAALELSQAMAGDVDTQVTQPRLFKHIYRAESATGS